MRWVSALLILGSAAAVPLATGAPTAGVTADMLPPMSTLPRLKPLWQLSGLYLQSDLPHFGNLLFATTRRPSRALVAIDTRTGKERWRAKLAINRSPHLSVIGSHVLADHLDGTSTAFDTATGAKQWTVKLNCVTELVAHGDFAAALCGGPLGAEQKITAFDLRTGRQLWRSKLGTSDLRNTLVGTPHHVIFNTVAETGAILLRGLSWSDGSLGLTASVAELSMAEILPFRDGLLVCGKKVTALRGVDLGVLWSATAGARFTCDTGPLEAPFVAFSYDGLLPLPMPGTISGLDIGTGREKRRWSVPRMSWDDHDQERRPTPPSVVADRLVTTVFYGPYASGPGFVATFHRTGERSLALAPAPGASTIGVVAEALLTVAYRAPRPPDHDVLPESSGIPRSTFPEDTGQAPRDLVQAWSLVETLSSEATALAPRERAQALLGRSSAGNRAGFLPDGPVADEFRAIPDVEALLERLAREKTSTERAAAIRFLDVLRVGRPAREP